MRVGPIGRAVRRPYSLHRHHRPLSWIFLGPPPGGRAAPGPVLDRPSPYRAAWTRSLECAWRVLSQDCCWRRGPSASGLRVRRPGGGGWPPPAVVALSGFPEQVIGFTVGPRLLTSGSTL